MLGVVTRLKLEHELSQAKARLLFLNGMPVHIFRFIDVNKIRSESHDELSMFVGVYV